MSEPCPLPGGRIIIVFTDIEDSSRMTAALGDHVYRRAVGEPHGACLRAAIQECGGSEVKTIGDSFMIAFPEGGVDQALACAHSIQKRLAEKPITARDGKGKTWQVRVRIGIHKAERELHPHPEGERWDYTGSDVNFAARVESLGAGGQVIVSDSTYRAANHELYAWQDWPDRRIKSFDQPETVWELLWDGRSRGEPGSRFLPDWYLGEQNRYIRRPGLEEAVLRTFAEPRADGRRPRLVTLHAEGGMGKTRLALTCAVQMAGRFAGGVYFVRLDDRPQSAEAVAEAIGAALGQTGEAALPERLLAHLGDREVLLVLDNYESVDCGAVQQLLGRLVTATRSVHLLVTGREAVRLSDVEQVIPLDEGMTTAEAKALFGARAQQKRPGWKPGRGERADLKRILGLTQNIPLAVELAAAWVGTLALAEIADGLAATPLGPLTGEMPRHSRAVAADRHQSLTRCLDWSYNRLEPEAQEGFTCLGLFADNFDAPAAAAVCGRPEAMTLLVRLLDASLLRRREAGGRSRYTLHRFTRSYAAEKLNSLPGADAIRRRYVVHYRALVIANKDINDLAKLAVLDAEWRNAIAAAETAERLQDWSAVDALSAYSGDFLTLRGLWSECERLDQRAVAAARSAQDRPAEGRALNNLGNVYQDQGRWSEAEAAYQQDLAICREFGDRVGEGKTLGNLALLCKARGDLPGALAQEREALRVFKTTQDEAAKKKAGNLIAEWEAEFCTLRDFLTLERRKPPRK